MREPEARPRPTPTPEPEPEEPPGDELPLEVERPIPGSLLLDIREPGEFAYGVAEGAMLLPMDLVPHHLEELPKDRPITVYCAAGARSFGVATWLRDMGFPGAASLAGGVGVFDAVGHPMRKPDGAGRRVEVPATATAAGVPLGVPMTGEVIEVRDGRTIAVVRDAFLVRVEFG